MYSRVAGPLVYKDSGSGDKTYDWVLQFCMLIVGVAGYCDLVGS